MTEFVPEGRRMVAELYGHQIPLVVRGMPTDCWKCSRPQTPVAVIHLAGYVDVDSVLDAHIGGGLAYARDLLELARHPMTPTIKPRYSSTVRESYLSNGCYWCDALFGAFFISDQIAEAQVNERVDQLPILVKMRRPQLEWVALLAHRDGLYELDED